MPVTALFEATILLTVLVSGSGRDRREILESVAGNPALDAAQWRAE
jgi:hypothetical protein